LYIWVQIAIPLPLDGINAGGPEDSKTCSFARSGNFFGLKMPLQPPWFGWRMVNREHKR